MKCLTKLVGVLLLVLVSAQAAKKRELATNYQTSCIVQNYYGISESENLSIIKYLDMINATLNELMKKVESCDAKRPTDQPKTVPKNCEEVLRSGGTRNGVYTIKPDEGPSFKVYCDQNTSGGGWAVIQRRQDGSVNFYRGWNDYKNGFGILEGEFWLGLDKIYRLTNQTRNRLRVELEDTERKTAYAEYSYFTVSNEQNKYRLGVGKYSGNAGDSLTYHNNAPFTTMDRDNDSNPTNCAVSFKGAWWYKSCHRANLNGLYLKGKHKTFANGINWKAWKGYYYSAKRAEMKIRPE